MTEESMIQCKLMTTSNKNPHIDVDEGVLRRATIQHYTSRFVAESSVNEKNHCYIKLIKLGCRVVSHRMFTSWLISISSCRRYSPPGTHT